MNRSFHLAALAFGLALALVALPLLAATPKQPRNKENPPPPPANPAPAVTPAATQPPATQPAPVVPAVTSSYEMPDGTKHVVTANRDALTAIAVMLNAHADLKGFAVTGRESTETGAPAKFSKTTHKFTLTWFGPNFFKVEQRPDDSSTALLQAGSDGKVLYSYDKIRESYRTAVSAGRPAGSQRGSRGEAHLQRCGERGRFACRLPDGQGPQDGHDSPASSDQY